MVELNMKNSKPSESRRGKNVTSALLTLTDSIYKIINLMFSQGYGKATNGRSGMMCGPFYTRVGVRPY